MDEALGVKYYEAPDAERLDADRLGRSLASPAGLDLKKPRGVLSPAGRPLRARAPEFFR